MPGLTTLEWVSLVVGTMGLVVTAASLIYAWMTSRRSGLQVKALAEKLVSIERLRLQQLMTALDLARFLSTDHEVVEKLWAPQAGPDVVRWLWQSHDKGADLYRILVDQYLSLTENFTYSDLATLCRVNFIRSHWEEDQWRRQMCLRPENRGVEAPNYCTSEAGKRHPTWHKKLEEKTATNSTIPPGRLSSDAPAMNTPNPGPQAGA